MRAGRTPDQGVGEVEGSPRPRRGQKLAGGTGRGSSVNLLSFLRASAQMVVMYSALELERQVLELRRHPWCGELHWRLTWRMYELAVDEQLLLAARAKLTGERFRRRHIEPPERIVAPSERITEAGRTFADVLELLRP